MNVSAKMRVASLPFTLVLVRDRACGVHKGSKRMKTQKLS